MTRARVRIQGRVQGVFFRDSCRRMAREHGVTGWVRNISGTRSGPSCVRQLADFGREAVEHALELGALAQQRLPGKLGAHAIWSSPQWISAVWAGSVPKPLSSCVLDHVSVIILGYLIFTLRFS